MTGSGHRAPQTGRPGRRVRLRAASGLDQTPMPQTTRGLRPQTLNCETPTRSRRGPSSTRRGCPPTSSSSWRRSGRRRRTRPAKWGAGRDLHCRRQRCCRSAVASVFKLRVNSFSCFLCRTWRPVAAHFQKFFGSAEHSRSGGRVIKTLGISLPDKRELPFQHCLVLYAAGI